MKIKCGKCGTRLNAPDTAKAGHGRCPACKALLSIPAAPGATQEEARPSPTPAPEDDPADVNWRHERREEIAEQILEDLHENAEWLREETEFFSSGKDLREARARVRLAGWLLRIGEGCPVARHLDGLLVLVKDAKARPDMLPPYDSCLMDSCPDCEIVPVNQEDVPKGTRVAELIDPNL